MGTAPSEDDVAVASPNITFQSRVMFEDGEKNRTPLTSTQKENYITHPVQDSTPAVPPKSLLSLSMPNVDPKDTYHSSYETSHTGELPSEDDLAVSAPPTTFQSRVVLADGSVVTPLQSTQKGIYVAHPTQDFEPHLPPKSQMDFTQPNVDPKESFQSSYKQSHKVIVFYISCLPRSIYFLIFPFSFSCLSPHLLLG